MLTAGGSPMLLSWQHYWRRRGRQRSKIWMSLSSCHTGPQIPSCSKAVGNTVERLRSGVSRSFLPTFLKTWKVIHDSSCQKCLKHDTVKLFGKFYIVRQWKSVQLHILTFIEKLIRYKNAIFGTWDTTPPGSIAHMAVASKSIFTIWVSFCWPFSDQLKNWDFRFQMFLWTL